jgi:hypothetical protein
MIEVLDTPQALPYFVKNRFIHIYQRRRLIMGEKKYKIQTTCPQCGCSAVSHLSSDEIREKFGDVPNVEMECSECMKKYQENMKKACPEWAEDCKM